MKIYTSCFFDKQRYKDMVPVSIALYSPKGFNGCRISKLAPTEDILNEYRRGRDEELYTKRYKEEILAKINCANAIANLTEYVESRFPNKDVVFLCYEKKGDFCHRHLVADWLKENGYECTEL